MESPPKQQSGLPLRQSLALDFLTSTSFIYFCPRVFMVYIPLVYLTSLMLLPSLTLKVIPVHLLDYLHGFLGLPASVKGQNQEWMCISLHFSYLQEVAQNPFSLSNSPSDGPFSHKLAYPQLFFLATRKLSCQMFFPCCPKGFLFQLQKKNNNVFCKVEVLSVLAVSAAYLCGTWPLLALSIVINFQNSVSKELLHDTGHLSHRCEVDCTLQTATPVFRLLSVHS